MVLDGFLNTGYFCSRLTAVLASVIHTLHGNFTPFKLPDNCEVEDEKLVLLADAASTAYWSVDHAGVKPGDTVIVVGCGPVGLLTQKFAWYKGAKRGIAVDYINYRLAHAKKANKVETINFEDYENVGDHLKEITQGGVTASVITGNLNGSRFTYRLACNEENLPMHRHAARFPIRGHLPKKRRYQNGTGTCYSVYAFSL